MHRKDLMKYILSFLILGMLLTVPASAQQSKSEETSRSLLDNEQVRVKELRLRPGAKIGPASNPNSFVYPLTEGTIVIAHPSKTPFEMSFRAGEALWIPSQEAAISNETSKEIRMLVVEIKQRAPVRAALKSKGKTKTKVKAKAGAKAADKPKPKS